MNKFFVMGAVAAAVLLTGCTGEEESAEDALNQLLQPTQNNASSGLQLRRLDLLDHNQVNYTPLSVSVDDDFYINWEASTSSYTVRVYLLKGTQTHENGHQLITHNCGTSSVCNGNEGMQLCDVTENSIACNRGAIGSSIGFFDSDDYDNMYIGVRICDALMNYCQDDKRQLKFIAPASAAPVVAAPPVSTTSPEVTPAPVVSESPTTSNGGTEVAGLLGVWDFVNSDGWETHNVELSEGQLHFDGIYTPQRYLRNDDVAGGEYAQAHVPELDLDVFTVGVVVTPLAQETSYPLFVMGHSRWLFLQKQWGQLFLFLNNYDERFLVELPINEGQANTIIVSFDRTAGRIELEINSQLQVIDIPVNYPLSPLDSNAEQRVACDYSCDLALMFTNYSSGLILKGSVDAAFVANGLVPIEQARTLLY